MNEEGSVGMKSYEEIQVIGKRLKAEDELSGIKSKASAQTIEGRFGNAEMVTERKNRLETSGEPGIKKRDYKSEGEGGMGDKDEEEEGMGLMTGSALKRGNGYRVAAYISLVIGDKISEIRAVEGEGRGRGVTGRTGRELYEKGIKGKVIKVFKFRKSLANI